MTKFKAWFNNFYSNYEKKKRNYYNGEINGGNGKIRIRTNDGDVVLRESN